jgi:hypothetical protein
VEIMLLGHVFQVRYALLMLFLLSVAANREDERHASALRATTGHGRETAMTVPALGIRG